MREVQDSAEETEGFGRSETPGGEEFGVLFVDEELLAGDADNKSGRCDERGEKEGGHC